jgi:hypothetical protein
MFLSLEFGEKYYFSNAVKLHKILGRRMWEMGKESEYGANTLYTCM